MTKLRGQTLVELLVAMFVISIGLFAAVGLVYSNLALVDRDTDEVVAVNLAREGAELAKEARDSNWLAGNAFDLGLSSGTDVTATPVWDGYASTNSFDFTTNSMSDPQAAVVQLTPLGASPGLFANVNTTAGIVGSATLFRRLLEFDSICSNYSVVSSTTCAASGLTKIGIRAQSQVQWVRKGITKNFTIYSDLYDWR